MPSNELQPLLNKIKQNIEAIRPRYHYQYESKKNPFFQRLSTLRQHLPKANTCKIFVITEDGINIGVKNKYNKQLSRDLKAHEINITIDRKDPCGHVSITEGKPVFAAGYFIFRESLNPEECDIEVTYLSGRYCQSYSKSQLYLLEKYITLSLAKSYAVRKIEFYDFTRTSKYLLINALVDLDRLITANEQKPPKVDDIIRRLHSPSIGLYYREYQARDVAIDFKLFSLTKFIMKKSFTTQQPQPWPKHGQRVPRVADRLFTTYPDQKSTKQLQKNLYEAYRIAEGDCHIEKMLVKTVLKQYQARFTQRRKHRKNKAGNVIADNQTKANISAIHYRISSLSMKCT